MKKLNNMIKLPLVLAITGSICALSLGLVHYVTEPIIAANTQGEINKMFQEFVPNSKAYEITDDYKTKNDKSDKNIFEKYRISKMYELKVDDKKVANAYRLLTKGFQGDSDIIVIVDDTKVIGAKAITLAIKGVSIPDSYLNNYKDKNYADIDGVDLHTGASITTGGLRDGIKNATNAHTELILGGEVIEKPKVSQEDFNKLEIEGATFVEKTDEFKAVQGESYASIFEKNGITNAYHILNEAGEKQGYFYYFETTDFYNQNSKGLFSFDNDGKNTKLVMIDTKDSLEWSDNAIHPTLSEYTEYFNLFNGLDINDVKDDFTVSGDLTTGATKSTKVITNAIKAICVNHKDY